MALQWTKEGKGKHHEARTDRGTYRLERKPNSGRFTAEFHGSQSEPLYTFLGKGTLTLCKTLCEEHAGPAVEDNPEESTPLEEPLPGPVEDPEPEEPLPPLPENPPPDSEGGEQDNWPFEEVAETASAN